MQGDPKMPENRNIWVLPMILVGIAAAIYVAFVLTRGSVDQSEWLGLWVTYGSVLLVFAAAALVVFRMLRRSRSSHAVDERRSHHYGR
jgi:hypothetical protein